MLKETRAERRIEIFVEGKDTETARFFLDVSPRGSKTEKFTFACTVASIAKERREIGNANRDAVRQVVEEAGTWLTVAQVVDGLRAKGLAMAPRTVSGHLKELTVSGGPLRGEGGVGSAKRYTGDLASNLAAI